MYNADLYTVIILCYRNFHYIYDAMESVFRQDYSAIELIISDDCSPNFPAKEIEEYLLSHKSEQVVSYKINHEPKNLGTVKHLNHARQLATGEYISFLACDDTLYGTKAITNFVAGFQKAGMSCHIEMAQTAMYDRNLKKCFGYYLQPEIQELLEDGNRQTELLEWLSISACLPSTSTCFRKTFFSTYGGFDEELRLVEDVPLHIRIASEKIALHYENFVAVCHRDGGISHGAAGALSETKRQYYRDIQCCHNRLMEKIDGMPSALRKTTMVRYRREKVWLDGQIYGRSSHVVDKILFGLRHPLFCARKLAMRGVEHYKTIKKILIALMILLLVTPEIGQMEDTLFSILESDFWLVVQMVELLLCICALIIVSICKISMHMQEFPRNEIFVNN